MTSTPHQAASKPSDGDVTLFLCGDVMLGRGVDQIMPRPCDPLLHEDYVRSAWEYVDLAERTNGVITRPVDLAYVWGTALDEFKRVRPDARIVNLETSITRDGEHAHKGIHYRMSPENAACLAAAEIDCCVLANNHVLDWGRAGLLDTLGTLERLAIEAAGAGRDAGQAARPAVLDLGGRVLVFSFAATSSGVPRAWAARAGTPGINLLPDLSDATIAAVVDVVGAARQRNDLVVVSVHWGPNWGYDVPADQRRFAHQIIERAGVSIVHGHSSHHPKAIEVHRDRLILYGCGDFLNDYEGIEGYGQFRDDLVGMYFARLDRVTGNLVSLEIVPLQISRLRLTRPSPDDVGWFARRIDEECRRYGAGVKEETGGRLTLAW